MSSMKSAILVIVGGILAGAAAGLLLAPQSGQATRRQLRGYAEKTAEHASDLTHKVTDAVKARRTMLDRTPTDELHVAGTSFRRCRLASC